MKTARKPARPVTNLPNKVVLKMSCTMFVATENYVFLEGTKALIEYNTIYPVRCIFASRLRMPRGAQLGVTRQLDRPFTL